MKKIVSLGLAFVMCLSLCACGKSKSATECENLINAIGEVSVDSKEAIETAEKAYEALTEKEKESIAESVIILRNAQEAYRRAYVFALSKDAYQNIKNAYDILTEFAVDEYEIWRISIFESNKVREQGVSFLSSYLRNISEEDLRKGLIMDATKRRDAGGTGMTDELVNNPDMYLNRSKNEYLWSICPYSVKYAYEIAGKRGEADGFIKCAKGQMKELSEKYSDYEHYPNLKGFFATVNSYLDTCFNQACSFEQFGDLIKEYEKEASDYIADLDYIFEN